MTEMEQAERRVLPVILVLDTSASMQVEGKIEALNRAVDELWEQLSQLRRSEDVDVRVGVLRFSSGCEWVTGEELAPVDELFLASELAAGGMTDLGAALQELNAKLSSQGLFRGLTDMYRPVIVFVMDGVPTDDWYHPLEAIRQNNEWDPCAIKIAIAVGDDVDAGTLELVVQGEENVFRADDGEQLRQLLPSRTMICCRASIAARTPPEPKIDVVSKAADRDVWEEAEDT